MKTIKYLLRSGWSFAPAIMAAGMLLTAGPLQAGTWTTLANNAPQGVQLMILLSDGTVACYDGGGGNWCKLSPNSSGSYVNGTFSSMASMNYTRRYNSAAVLRNGRLFVAGGEYGTGTNTAEVYNPLTDVWTLTGASGVTDFVDPPSAMLPDGRVLVYAVNHGTIARGTVIYNPAGNSFVNGPATFGSQNESSWVKLPDDSILTVDKNSTAAERYIPSLNTWIHDAAAPQQMYGNGSEIGPAVLLLDGRAWFIGGNGNTCFYTPSGTTNNGTWAIGPDLPNTQGCPDAPGAVMVNGHVLFTCSPYAAGTNVFSTPTSYYDYDPVANTFAQQNSPYGGLTANRASYTTCLLDLPDGNVLYSDQGSQLYVYTPGSAALASARPSISTVSWHGNGTLRMTGTQLNGKTGGAYYGDDLQMDSNYPLVRFSLGGNVYYGRTHDWSSTGVATGGEVVSTEFNLPSAVFNGPGGAYSMVAVANGVASLSQTFYGPIWVDFGYSGFPIEIGSNPFPYNTLAEGVSAVAAGGTIAIKPGSRKELITITKAMNIIAVGGTVTIGN